ncbi:MAG: hypothetical protein IKE38_03925 [Erysipelotrichaceae bacterium]|nr:hypothetical protein [Erysipelotrichaceae bacterium]
MIKRLLKTLLITVVFLFNVSCSKLTVMIDRVTEPKTEYETLEEINETAGTCLVRLPVNGISDERYYMTADDIAEYDFTFNGLSCCFRASKTLNKDISGVRIDGDPAFVDMSEDMSVNFEDKNLKIGRFTVKDVQYSLSFEDGGNLSYSDFAGILADARDTISQIVFSEEIKGLIGMYYDSYSMRAHAEISLVDNSDLVVDVQWSDSAYEYEEWIMFVRYDGERLNYDDSIHISVVQTYNGEEAVPYDDGGSGYFEIIDGRLYWTGSGDPNTEQCVFERSAQ